MNIWVPKGKIIEPKRELVLPTRLQGFFKLEAVHRSGRRRLLADWFPNLITDAGLNRIGTNTDMLAACQVGTGSTTPNVADTGLAAYVAGSATQQSYTLAAQATEPYYGSHTKTYRFGEGVAAGNLAEIGIATATSGGTMFSRALILDGGGSPTTITVLSDEYLDATYQLRIYPPLSDVLDTITIDAVNYGVTNRASFVTTAAYWANTMIGGLNLIGYTPQVYDGAIGAITAGPSGSADGQTSWVNATYGSNNYYRDFTSTWGLNDGNVGGVASVWVPMGIGAVQVGFDIDIPKDNTKILSLTFRHSWARGTVP